MLAADLSYLAALLVAAGGWLSSVWTGRDGLFLPRRWWGRLLVALVMTYLLSLASCFHDPTWEDNGVMETMVFPEHFGWALMVSGLFQWLVVPVVLLFSWWRNP